MDDNIKMIMTELDGIREIVQCKKEDYQQSNIIHNTIEDLEILMSYLERDFTELDSRLTEFRDNLNDTFLEIASELEVEE